MILYWKIYWKMIEQANDDDDENRNQILQYSNTLVFL